MVNLFLTIIRALFAMIDTLVVWLIKNLYILLVQIANTNVFGDFIYQMLGRIYVFLGIFMLFKLSMSMITYIINPDAMTDKNKGFGKLITNVVISLILIVTVPSIFKEAYRLQSIILNSNAVYQIVTGEKINSNDVGDSNSDVIKNAGIIGDDIAKGVFKSFVYKNTSVGATTNEVEPPEKSEGVACSDASCYVAVETVTLSKDGNFVNEYKFLLSTICGAVVAYFFLVFCLDAAVRAIKLGVLQIIAPIPILSMIDPKGGNDKLKKWASNCGKEYAGLFIRLAGVYFAVSVINLVLGTNSVDNAMTYYETGEPVGLFVQLFIIIGALMFAKQLPQFIEQVLGIKLSSENGGFNLKKKLAGAAGLGAVAGVGALGAKKLVAGLDSSFHGKGFLNGARSIQGNGFISKMQKGWREITPNHQQFKKTHDTMRQRHKDINRGEKLFEKNNGNENQLLSTLNRDYVNSYNRAEDLKKEMFKAESELEAAKQSGDAQKIQEASGAYGAAKKKYELANADYEDMKILHPSDAKDHDAFNLYKKMYGGPAPSISSSPTATSTISSASSSNVSTTSTSVYDRVRDVTGQTHMENRERHDWSHESAFATMSESDFNEMVRKAEEGAASRKASSSSSNVGTVRKNGKTVGTVRVKKDQ